MPISSAYTLHQPILIEGNGEFTAQNGVTGGSGSPADPYRIEGWDISGPAGIEVRNTTAYFVIRDNFVHDGDFAIFLVNVTHARVTTNALWNNGYGVIAFYTNDLAVNRNEIGTDFPTVWGGGIHPFQSTDVWIAENRITRSGEGVYIQNSANVTVISNRIEGDDDRSEGVRLWVSTDVTIVCNDVVDHSIGIRVFNWNTGIVAYHNNILSSAYAQAQDDEANTWDDGYPSGGNYWSDYTGQDQYSGPDQDQPGPDGIGDSPRTIDADSADAYPLMTPAACSSPTRPPITNLDLGTPSYLAEVPYVAPHTPLILSAIDSDGYGLRGTSYRVDGAAWTEYGGAFTIPAEGEHVLEWFSEDNRGSTEDVRSQVLRVDGTPPVTVLEIGLPTFQGDVLYVSQMTLFELRSADRGETPVGSLWTRFRIGGGPWFRYENPFQFVGDGPRTLEFTAADVLGNGEPLQSVSFVVDDSPPVSTPIVSGSSVRFEASDAGCGVRSILYRVDDGVWRSFEGPVAIADGHHTVRYKSLDNLGNEEAERSLVVEVASPPAQESPPLNSTAAAVFALAVILSLILAAWLARRRRTVESRERKA